MELSLYHEDGSYYLVAAGRLMAFLTNDVHDDGEGTYESATIPLPKASPLLSFQLPEEQTKLPRRRMKAVLTRNRSIKTMPAMACLFLNTALPKGLLLQSGALLQRALYLKELLFSETSRKGDKR